jgi:hypothetical protein
MPNHALSKRQQESATLDITHRWCDAPIVAPTESEGGLPCATLWHLPWRSSLTTASARQPTCRFVLGFATLRDLVRPQKVGTCLEDEHFNDQNGSAEQRTSGGLLVWRKVDNLTAFTDGSTSWINGPK